jgi:hypothetical protein
LSVETPKYIAKGIKYFAILMLYFSFTLSV